MSSLFDKIKQQKLREAGGGERPQITTADINIRGSGLTKREAEKNTRAYERETSKAIKSADVTAAHDAEERLIHSIDATLEEMRAANEKNVLKYDDSQLLALAGIKHNRVATLIGAAGVGKTTVTREIVNQLKDQIQKVRTDETIFVQCENEDGQRFRVLYKEALAQNYKIIDKPMVNEEVFGIAFAAFTGRASQQIKRAIPEEFHRNISTIHSLLGYAPVMEEYEWTDPVTGFTTIRERKVFRPSFGKDCKLPYRFYVLDEASMIPIPLWNELIDAMPEGSRILTIGDIHQLPPPYGKGVLGYCLNKWPVFELTTIHRQAAGNAIITNAHHVLNGRPLENAKNFHIIGNNTRAGGLTPTGQGDLQAYFLNVIKQLSTMKKPDGEFCYDPIKDNIIVPSNKNLCGQIALNEKLVVMFNPEKKENGVIINKRIKIHTGNNFVYFALGDKVAIGKNINTEDPPITNGMLGIVESINLNGKYDMKRAQIELDTGDDTDEDPLDLDFSNFDLALKKFDGGKDEEEKKKDETEDQRQASHVMTIKFENGQSYSCSTAGDFRSVAHGYATTCHKAQGGEYPNIIVLCHSINSVQLNQEWLYTALTRARNNVYLVCNARGLNQALARQTIKGKTLAEKIRSYLIDNKIDEEGTVTFDRMRFPELFEPQEI